MAIYGAHLGTAFQLIDDVLDYSGAEVETASIWATIWLKASQHCR
jgi:geranylgeranyl pyrophosphate synthase